MTADTETGHHDCATAYAYGRSDAINELIESLEAGPGDSFASVAEVVGLIRELTGVAPE